MRGSRRAGRSTLAAKEGVGSTGSRASSSALGGAVTSASLSVNETRTFVTEDGACLFGDEREVALLHALELDRVRCTDHQLIVVVIHKAQCVEPGGPDRLRGVAT